MRRTCFFSPPLLFFPWSVEFAFRAGLGRPGVLLSPAVFLKKNFYFLFGNLFYYVSGGPSPALPPAAGAAPAWSPAGLENLLIRGWALPPLLRRPILAKKRQYREKKFSFFLTWKKKQVFPDKMFFAMLCNYHSKSDLPQKIITQTKQALFICLYFIRGKCVSCSAVHFAKKRDLFLENSSLSCLFVYRKLISPPLVASVGCFDILHGGSSEFKTKNVHDFGGC